MLLRIFSYLCKDKKPLLFLGIFKCNLISNYVENHNMGFTGIEKIMISLTRNDYEPDICYFGPRKASLLSEKQMQFPAPDLIVEVLSSSTEKNDRGV